jgi:peptidoglycan hydrolase FlgJ
MPLEAIQRRVQAREVPLERLSHNPHLTQQEKVGEASRQFEAVLVRQILQDAQKPVIKSKLNPDSTAASVYRDMVTSRLADSISKSGELGLAQMLNQQLNHKAAKNAEVELSATGGGAADVSSAPSSVSAHPPHWPAADAWSDYQRRHAPTVKSLPTGSGRPGMRGRPVQSKPVHTAPIPAKSGLRPLRASTPTARVAASKPRPVALLHGASLILAKP